MTIKELIHNLLDSAIDLDTECLVSLHTGDGEIVSVESYPDAVRIVIVDAS